MADANKWELEMRDIFKARLGLLCRETHAKVYRASGLELTLTRVDWFNEVCSMLKDYNSKGFLELIPKHIALSIEALVANNEDYSRLFKDDPDVMTACKFKLEHAKELKKLPRSK